MTNHRIVLGDSRNLHLIPDKSVQLIVTSPPYWQLKDYGVANQIGFHDDYSQYINNLNLVWQECYRVLSDGCRMCINIGDQFARSVYYGRYKVIPIRTEIIRFCETLGMDYMGAIIWQKQTTMNTTGGGSVMGSYPYPRNGILKIDYEFILLFKKLGNAPKPTAQQKADSAMTKEEWNTFFASHWNFGGARQEQHLAMFPEELPRRLIKMFTFVGETVLDPFLGSGTTSRAAMNLGRHSIGYEINRSYRQIIHEKLSQIPLAAGGAHVTMEEDNASPKDESNLPYVFVDPHQMQKKVDSRTLTFGSKIDKTSSTGNEFYTVKHILAPEIVQLNTGANIRLLGIKAIPGLEQQAIDFLRAKTDRQRVYLKFDSVKYDSEERLMAYLYLSNRTFVNAHLLKSGLVSADDDYSHRYAIKFKEIEGRGEGMGA